MEKHAAELLLQRMLGNTTATFRGRAMGSHRRGGEPTTKTAGCPTHWLGKVPCTSSPVKSSAIAVLARTIIISPLLALMRNQVAAAAERLGITAETLNSTNRGRMAAY